MKKTLIRLTESDLHRIISETIKEIGFDNNIYKEITDFDNPNYADDAFWGEEDDEDTDRQTIGSEKTSRKQIPFTFRPNKGLSWVNGEHNLDIGGGAHNLGTEELMNREGVINLVFDPYNRESDFNSQTLDKVESLGGADSVTVNSCLNVIKGRKFVEQVIHQAANALKPEGIAVFKIHPGDTKKGEREAGDGMPRTTINGYQQFKKAKKYVPLIHKYFSKLYIDNAHDCIVAKDPISMDTRANFYPDKDGQPRQLKIK